MKKIQSIAIWLTATLFALYELFITNGFYGISLALQQQDLNLPAGATGALAAAASLIYAICQIPAGILVSRSSIKFILTLCSILVAVGMAIYCKATGIEGLILGRMIIAVGSSFAFVSVAILISRWLPREKFSWYYGLTQCLGNISVVCANMFLPQIINFVHGWRAMSLILALVGGVIAVLIFIVIKTNPTAIQAIIAEPQNKSSVFSLLKKLVSNQQFWIVNLFAGLMLGTLFSFGANWLIGFQNYFDGNNLSHSALVSSILFLGVAVGNPIVGALSLRFQTRKKFFVYGSLFSSILMGILVFTTLNSSLALVLYFLLGLGLSTTFLCYSVIMEILPNELQGLGVGLCNTVVYFSGALLSIVIGTILHEELSALVGNSANILFEQRVGLALFFFTLSQAFTISLFIRESFKKE
jgi:MFS family permease